jgi:hypothetical protein
MAFVLPEIFAAEKEISNLPAWAEGADGRLDLVALLEIGGVTIEGLQLRGRARKDCPDEELMFQLECAQPGRRDRAIDRIDWRPHHVHTNSGKGPPELRYLRFDGSHQHGFNLNWLSTHECMRANNLPIADALRPDHANFVQLLDFVLKCYRITNSGLVKAPPWEGALL